VERRAVRDARSRLRLVVVLDNYNERVLTPDQKGSIAEVEIARAVIRLGLGVYKPLNDGERYDLILDLRPRLLRVQCKWAVHRRDVVVISCQSCRRAAEGYRRRTYSAEEIDAIAAYCGATNACYLLLPDSFVGRPSVLLRVAPARNNQRAAINWADDFKFEATIARSGAVAQLGERQLGMLEVTGSSPVGSTPQAPSTVVGAHSFRNHFGWYMQRAAAGEEIAVTRRGKRFVRLTAA
jgi:prevent-host-death family protein